LTINHPLAPKALVGHQPIRFTAEIAEYAEISRRINWPKILATSFSSLPSSAVSKWEEKDHRRDRRDRGESAEKSSATSFACIASSPPKDWGQGRWV